MKKVAAKNTIKRPTSVDVARLAGVSQSTVSNVINNRTDIPISEDTRERVLQAIMQLDYQPHEAARHLRSQSSHILGMAIPEMYNMHYIETYTGASDYAQKENYSVSLMATNFSLEKELQCVNWLMQMRYDGLILTTPPGNVVHDELYPTLRQGYPITTLGFHDPLIDSVIVTEVEGEKQIFHHLAQLGHEKIGYIYGVIDHAILNHRLATCLFIQEASGLPVESQWICRCGSTLEDGYQATTQLLHALPRDAWPTVLIVVNDLLAIGVLSALHDLGLTIPHDMSVISFDNVPFAAHTIPALTTVAVDAQLMGKAAAQLVIERLKDPQRPPTHVEVHPELIVRSSTTKPRNKA